MRPIVLAAAALLIASTPLAAASDAAGTFDAVAAAPGSHTVLLENDEVRVLRVVVAPGATEPVHVHTWPSVMRFEQPQPITYIAYDMLDGKLVETRRIEVDDLAVGGVEWAAPEGLHAVHNRGTAPFVALRVELKRAGEGER